MTSPEGTHLEPDVVMELRRHLWLGHGHYGIYGDDGQMQCSECGAAYRLWDYKIAPLADVIRTAIRARIDTNLASASAPRHFTNEEIAALRIAYKLCTLDHVTLGEGAAAGTILRRMLDSSKGGGA